MNVLNFIGGAVGLYRIVPANEAHVRILFDKKNVFMSRTNVDAKPDYWVVPFVTKVHKLPLANIRIDVPDVKLNDKNMAKFSCDIVCFVNIADPMLAAERTSLTTEMIYYEKRGEQESVGIKDIAEDFRAIMESIGRTVATKQSILEIYMDRQALDNAVTKEVEGVFPKWGLQLVDLEIKDLRDVDESAIIQDIEKKIAATISADARVKVAEEGRRASIAEAEATKEAELVRAKTEEEWGKRKIEKDRTLAVAVQEKEQQAAKQEQTANAQKVEALRTKNVGEADVERETVIKLAEATKQKLSIEAEGEAAKIQNVGQSEANIIKAKKLADAEGTEKLALAQQKFNEAATSIEMIKANKEVGLKLADAYEKGLQKASINIVSGQSADLVNGGILGTIRLGGKEGVAIQQFLQGLPEEQQKKFNELVGKLTSGRKTSGKREDGG
jgi:flotillin